MFFGLEDVYAGSQLSFSYTFTQVSSVGATIAEMQSPDLPVGKGGALLVGVRQFLFLQIHQLLPRKSPVVVPRRLVVSILSAVLGLSLAVV